MKGIQYIIDNAQSIEVNRSKTIGQLVVRSGRIKSAERASTVPWQMVVTPPAYAKFEDVRDVIESVTLIDRNTPFYIDFGATSVSGLNWVSEYQGDLTSTQVNNLTVSTGTDFLGTGTWNVSSAVNYSGVEKVFNYMRITNLPSVSSSTYIFRAGDWVQLATSADPWGQYSNYVTDLGGAATVPVDVQRGSGTYVDVPVHRPFVFNGTATITTNGRAGCDINVGNQCRLQFVMTKMPTWKLMPGKLVQWSGDFEFYEYISG